MIKEQKTEFSQFKLNVTDLHHNFTWCCGCLNSTENHSIATVKMTVSQHSDVDNVLVLKLSNSPPPRKIIIKMPVEILLDFAWLFQV